MVTEQLALQWASGVSGKDAPQPGSRRHTRKQVSQSSSDTGVTLIPIVHSRSWASEIVCAFLKSLSRQCGAGFETPARGASGDAGEDSFMGALPSPGVTELFLLVPTELDP